MSLCCVWLLFARGSTLCWHLIDLDGRIYLIYEHVGRVEADCARQYPECERNQRRVAEVEQCRHELGDVKLCKGVKLLKTKF